MLQTQMATLYMKIETNLTQDEKSALSITDRVKNEEVGGITGVEDIRNQITKQTW